MNTVAIVQARMGSTRLPGKVLRRLDGLSIVELICERLKNCETIDRIVVATSRSEKDDPLAEELKRIGIPCYRGDESDVLDRYFQAASVERADIVVRITGDCPLIDPEVVDTVVRTLKESPALAYVSNFAPPTFPDGLDAEAMTFAALSRMWQEARSAFDREHVTPYLRANPEWFPQVNIASDIDYSGYRWTLDEERDFAFLHAFVASAKALGIDPRLAGLESWLHVAENEPRLSQINEGIVRNAGSMQPTGGSGL
ncbi:cytidylyltransferase domain-containing protein [Cohnella soli]|uniref:Cytidylyltransferase domain-containing protein n=1 Tax=Cohnella soli TaxID=425005 RepID=A0ABW0I154_9BACL